MTKEGDAGAGLLGKVARFIKTPTTDWADVARPASGDRLGADSPESRLALKEMIERKRRNDFVRKREFDMLRKIRHRDSKAVSDALDTVTLTSSYTDSQMLAYAGNSSHDDEQKRAQTLRKIDEIEAQVSSSWFRKTGKTVPANLPRAQRPAAPGGFPATDAQRAARPASGYAPSAPPPTSSGRAPVDPPTLTQLYQPSTAVPAMPAAPRRATAPTVDAPRPAAPSPARAPASSSRALYDDGLEDNIEVATLRQDPEVEEAAINFANGDPTGAELTLLRLVGMGGSRRSDVEVWLTLFDLYRVTNNTDAFDGLVPEFTALFGRSAPQWERDRAPAGDAPSAKGPALQTTREGAFAWSCPAQLNDRAITALTGAVKRTAPPWRIDWHAVKTVTPDALAPLSALFTQWADSPTQLQFLGDGQLLAALAERSPTGDRSADPAWWNARLALLRLMGAPDPFDQTALDYCITYEISPPAWTPSKSAYTALSSDGHLPETASAPLADAPAADFGPTTITAELQAATGVCKATLEGEILDSANHALAALPQNMSRIQAIDFNCRALRRVDFGAAGELLNWSIEQQSHGRAVTFRGVHRLLAAFLNVIGVNTVARVVLRKD